MDFWIRSDSAEYARAAKGEAASLELHEAERKEATHDGPGLLEKHKSVVCTRRSS